MKIHSDNVYNKGIILCLEELNLSPTGNTTNRLQPYFIYLEKHQSY